jgi:hypothetical protein
MNEPLMLRDEPQRDITTRSFQVRAATVNEVQRSVEATISTESPVEVVDWNRLEVIDEVLLGEAAAIPTQMPLLANHSRYSLDDVIGSIRGLRLESGSILGRLHFADDEQSERAWQKVRAGHITDVSVGYRVNESVEIQSGQTAIVKGRTYTAGKRTLRVATNWTPKEGSLVPIGADKAAKIREESTLLLRKGNYMDSKLRAYLESIGLRKDASDDEAKTFYNGLTAEQRTAADASVRSGEPPIEDPPADPPVDPPTPEAAAQRAIADERLRVRQLTELAGDDVPEAIRQRAISEGLSVAAASPVFLAAVRESRQTGPAIQSRSHEADCTRESLAAGFMVRNGLDPVTQNYRFIDGCYVPRRDQRQTQQLEQAAERGWQYRDMSLLDICRESLRLDCRRIPTSRGEMIRAAMSGSTLSAIFTTNVSAALMAAYTEAEDSTAGWVSEADVPNFQTNERAMMGKIGALTKHGRGGTADDLKTSDSKEEYKIARYSGKFTVDEMDIIDDRFGAIEGTTPAEIGNAARSLRPDMVYAILLLNAALVDTGTLFNATAISTAGGHANSTTGALASATLQTAINLMAKQRIEARPLNIRPKYLIVPPELVFTAQICIGSAFRYSSEGDLNPLADLLLQIRSDDRIAVAGVTNPVTGTASAGTATNYFLAAQPGVNGAKTIEVGYLRGTGRAPQIRSYVLTQGQWGLGWDVNMDLGAKALDFRALVKSTGA